MSAIRIEDVSFAWEDQAVLRKIAFEVSAGRFAGIIGPNGSGKSTLLKCVYRVLQPDAGSIFLNGNRTRRMSCRETAKLLGVVAQQDSCAFDFTVRDVVLMGRYPHKKLLEKDNLKDIRILQDALREVGLSGFEARSFAQLSGGEQQRVIPARALVQETAILILDEPTNHLDIKYQLQLLNTVKAQKKTVLAAFHDLNIAAMYCDDIYVLNGGRLVAHGCPTEVLTAEMIRQVYGVSAVVTEASGFSHIVFRRD